MIYSIPSRPQFIQSPSGAAQFTNQKNSDFNSNQSNRMTVNYRAPTTITGNTQVYPQVNEDSFLDPSQHLSSKQVLTSLGSGFALGFAGKEILKLFVEKSTQKDIPFDSNIILKDDPSIAKELNIWQYYKDPLSSMLRIVQTDPSQSPGILAYACVCMIGYLAGNLVQGTKETWVRREETKIRAHLIDKLQSVVQKSIHSKYNFNNQLREIARRELIIILKRNNISDTTSILNIAPIIESANTNRLFFYQPTHRTIDSNSLLRFGLISPDLKNYKNEPFNLIQYQKAALFGFGFLSGFVVNNFIRLLTSVGSQSFKCTTTAIESVQLNDFESWCMLALKNRKNLVITLGLFSMTSAATVGATLTDGLREVEVTRLNAKTELDYQAHNWLTQDPAFHSLAERESLQNELILLEQDLPYLKSNPELLRQRIQTIIANVGRNSAPPYYPMTPTVNLVEART